MSFFSSKPFVDAVARAVPGFSAASYPGDLHGIVERGRLGQRTCHLGPYALYARPKIDRIDEIVANLRAPMTELVRWTVRYDGAALSTSLAQHGFTSTGAITRVVPLHKHEEAFARYSTTRRRQVRKAQRDGVTVEITRDPADVRAYYALYTELPFQQGRTELDYPLALFLELAKLPESIVTVARLAGEIIAGALFFRDGDSLFYFNSAADRRYSHVFATCAILDHAIALGCTDGYENLNLGSSGGIESLEEFKDSWGAEQRPYWKMQWVNPAWRRVAQARNITRRAAGLTRRSLIALSNRLRR